MTSAKDRIAKDLKDAMLAGNKDLVTVLRGLKSAILYEEVSQGVREQGLTEERVLSLLMKEAKKRSDSAELYRQGGSEDRAQAELREKEVIEAYLPKQVTEEEITKAVQAAIEKLDDPTMGFVIAEVKKQFGAAADGATIARLTKQELYK